MRQKAGTAESMVKDIRRRRQKHHSCEEKMHILLGRLRHENSVGVFVSQHFAAVVSYVYQSVDMGQACSITDMLRCDPNTPV
ncbi:hypothetical protein [Thioclava sp. JE_KL1]|uniref:hypothetical protein n=1 Tax=Thioclava sp. JE_KL1 TaxID=2651187 RepID=UPI00128E46A1|nr:hypothetical protein [Thioclava sp. JE_KL1]MPQ96178.1 hypothetical protein [Thioclava sp. JE_KL1]